MWAGLAQELERGARRCRGGAAIAAALRRARELDPGEARYRAELALRAKASSQEAETHDDEKYIVPSQVILARRVGARGLDRDQDGGTARPRGEIVAPLVRGHPRCAGRGGPAASLAARRRDAPGPSGLRDGPLRARDRRSPPRTEDELYEDVPAEGDLTEILRARVHRKDGGEAFPVEEANENAQPRIRWPELAPGDVVEVAFRSWTAGPVGGRGDPPFYRLDYAGALDDAPDRSTTRTSSSLRPTGPSTRGSSTAKPIASRSTTRTGATS